MAELAVCTATSAAAIAPSASAECEEAPQSDLFSSLVKCLQESAEGGGQKVSAKDEDAPDKKEKESAVYICLCPAIPQAQDPESADSPERLSIEAAVGETQTPETYIPEARAERPDAKAPPDPPKEPQIFFEQAEQAKADTYAAADRQIFAAGTHETESFEAGRGETDAPGRFEIGESLKAKAERQDRPEFEAVSQSGAQRGFVRMPEGIETEPTAGTSGIKAGLARLSEELAPSEQTPEAQIVRSVKENLLQGRNEFTFRLKPRSLGEVTITLSLKEEKIEMSIKSETQSTKELILGRLGELRSELEASGYAVDSFNVETRAQGSADLGAGAYSQPRETGQGGYRHQPPIDKRGRQGGGDGQSEAAARRVLRSGIINYRA